MPWEAYPFFLTNEVHEFFSRVTAFIYTPRLLLSRELNYRTFVSYKRKSLLLKANPHPSLFWLSQLEVTVHLPNSFLDSATNNNHIESSVLRLHLLGQRQHGIYLKEPNNAALQSSLCASMHCVRVRVCLDKQSWQRFDEIQFGNLVIRGAKD